MNIEPRPGLKTVLTVHSPEDFRESLPSSGVFDIFDCKMLVEFNPNTVLQHLEQYVTILESCINLVDLDVQPGRDLDEEVRITISEVPLHVAENRTAPERFYPASKPVGRPHPSNRLSQYMGDEDGLDEDEFDND